MVSNKNAIKISEENSVSGIIVLEALLVGCFLGLYLHFKQGWHGALATTIAIFVIFAVYYAIVYVEFIFWIWSVSLGSGVAYLVFNYVSSHFGDTGWAIFWAVLSIIIIVGFHMDSREHNQAEDTPNKIKILK